MSTLDTLQPRQIRDPYDPVIGRLIETEPLTDLERLFVFELSDGQALGHRPGQFVQVWVPGIGEAPISICSSPTRGRTFELCVRRVGEVTSRLHRLTAGDEVGIRGPLGNGFDISAMEGMNIIVVAGGLGLAPARSIIQYILDERDRFDEFFVLYGARSPEEILFKHDLIQWRHRKTLNLLQTVDRPDAQWRGRSGVVTKLFADLPPVSPLRTCAVVIGPPVMFKFVIVELLAREIPHDRIFCSLERRMRCGIGKCGHCQINMDYVCVDGPVFTYKRMRELPEAVT